ncbi:hypothetical protein [uncultured Nocardioides sp.]|uniref:hypothetical protein n=1 Tax=uncultured Nocardioides sp. TaxID=198441 RepID=UPI00262D90A9|nr:hypothetical protein [uncultured Nocardioides sp.]
MRIFTVAVLSAAVAAGTGGAVVAYDLATPPVRSADETTTPTQPANEFQRRATRPRFAPCRPPAKLERGTCVTNEVRTVLLPSPQIQTQPVRQARATSSATNAPSDQTVRDDDHDSRGNDLDDHNDPDDDRDHRHRDDRDHDDHDDRDHDDRDDDDRDHDDRDHDDREDD